LIAFQYGNWRQHMPDAIIVEDVTLTRFAHREAIHMTVRGKNRPWPQPIVPKWLTTIGAGNDLNLI
jgi:hypothetical protein